MKKIFISFVSILLLASLLFGCARIEYNATIIRDGFAFNLEWLENNYTKYSRQGEYNNDLPESRTYVINNQEDLNEVFASFPQIDFDTEMVIVYCYTTTCNRKQKLDSVSFDNGVLNIKFGNVKAWFDVDDATSPQTRTCIIRMDKVEATDVNVTYG